MRDWIAGGVYDIVVIILGTIYLHALLSLCKNNTAREYAITMAPNSTSLSCKAETHGLKAALKQRVAKFTLGSPDCSMQADMRVHSMKVMPAPSVIDLESSKWRCRSPGLCATRTSPFQHIAVLIS